MSNSVHSNRVVVGTVIGLGAGFLTYWYSKSSKSSKSSKKDSKDDLKNITVGCGPVTEIRQGSGGQVIRYGDTEIIQGAGGQVIRKRGKKNNNNNTVGSGRPSFFKACLCGALTGSMVLGLFKFSENTAENGGDFALASLFGAGALCVNQSDDEDWNNSSDISFCIIL